MNQNEPQNEEILLYSADADSGSPDTDSLNNITGQLSQYHKWKMQSKFIRIHDGKLLSIVEHFLTSSKKYQVRLVHLDPTPVRIRTINYRLGLLSLLVGALACLPLNDAVNSLMTQWTTHTLSISVVLITISLLAFSLMLYRSKNTLVFVSHYGRHPMVTLLHNNPSKDAFRMFSDHLAGQIRQSRQDSLLNKSQQLAAELGELRRLRDESALSEAEYEVAKTNIFSHHADT